MEKTDTIILSPEELAAYMAESTISVTSTYEHSPVVLMVDDTVIGTLGNFSASIGKAKSKKTFNISAIVASALSGSTVLHYRSTFPENKLIGSPETFGWAVVSTYSEKVKKGAVEFLKFRTKLNKEQKEELLNSSTRQEGTLLDDYLKAYTGNPQIVPNYQVKWNSLLQEDVLGECLAELAQGKITEQEFTQAEDESIRQFEEEQ